jgi:hypothetical protein
MPSIERNILAAALAGRLMAADPTAGRQAVARRLEPLRRAARISLDEAAVQAAGTSP